MAEEAGADAIGVVVFSESPRSVTPEAAQEIFSSVGPFITRVCVSTTGAQSDLETIIDLNPDAVQLSLPLAERLPIRTIGVVDSPGPLPRHVDAIVVDASRGTGRLFDAAFAGSVVRESPVPVILAGGLTPANVAGAVRQVRPYGVDVATGVEVYPGRKDGKLLEAFIREAKGAYHG
ncbi:MAG: phosphoribosylanthranilate isomerase [Methanolinea sp.]|nr:phosphoribosylanthranilate isomerase [Methanolinea sp.]